MNQTANLDNAENLQLYKLNPYTRTKNSREIPSGTSQTIPDQSLTIKQILERHTRGLRIPDQMVGYYDSENDPLELNGTNIETLDLSQKYDILNRVRNKTSNLRSAYNKQQTQSYEEKLREEGRQQAQKAEKNPVSQD
jgi:hypothetical protein